jgi:hypothetical protein
MEIVLITGHSGTGKNLILNGLRAEYKTRKYSAIFIDNLEKKDDIGAAITKAMIAKGGHLPPAFCVITSLELTQKDFDKPLYRVIRTGRS